MSVLQAVCVMILDQKAHGRLPADMAAVERANLAHEAAPEIKKLVAGGRLKRRRRGFIVRHGASLDGAPGRAKGRP